MVWRAAAPPTPRAIPTALVAGRVSDKGGWYQTGEIVALGLALIRDFANAILGFVSTDVTPRWTEFYDDVSDYFRIIDTANFRGTR